MRVIGLTLLALFSLETAIAQGGADATAMKRHAATASDLRDTITEVVQITHDLHQNMALYQEHLRRAMEIYGRGYYDPTYHQKVSGFDQDIRTGDPTQTEKIKRGVFSSILLTAGVHLDPDPLHDWAEVEKCLDHYQSALSRGNSMSLESNVWDAARPANVALETAQKLRSEWDLAVDRAEHERKTATSLRPAKLGRGQTFAGQATEGMNLRFTLFGVEFGRELGNVNALVQLTFVGPARASHTFLLTVLTAAEQKTRTDTWVSSRTLLIHSDASDSARYGYVIASQDHGDYRVTGAHIADVAPKVHDWIWKSTAAHPTAPATVTDLEQAVQHVKDTRGAIKSAIASFQQLSFKAVQENDAVLIAASGNHKHLKLPDQDLRLMYPEVRAKLYAVRALSAGDPRFLSGADAVNAARMQAEAAISDGRERFSYFNDIATYTAPELPWKNIQKLAAEFMDVADDVRDEAEKESQSLPQPLEKDEASINVHLNFIVEQQNQGPAPGDQKTFLINERILRDVHWAVKGIPRREYSSERIEVSATGLQRVQSVSEPSYVQGPGGIRQVFQDISKQIR